MNGVGDVVVCAFVGGDARGAVGDGYRWKVKGEWCNVGEVECDGEGEADVCLFFFVFLLFACFSLVFVRFVVEGSVERVLVMVTSSFLLFPFSRFSSAVSLS